MHEGIEACNFFTSSVRKLGLISQVNLLDSIDELRLLFA